MTEFESLQNEIARISEKGTPKKGSYSKELKTRAAKLVERTRQRGVLSDREVAETLNLPTTTLRNWVKQYGENAETKETKMSKSTTVSKLKAALQLSKEDLTQKRLDRMYEDSKVASQRSIEDDERKLADMKLDLEDLLNPETLENSNVFERYVTKSENIKVAEKRLEMKKSVFAELYGA